MVVLGADEKHPPGPVELHDVVAGAPGPMVLVMAARSEVFLADLDHIVFPLAVLEHCETTVWGLINSNDIYIYIYIYSRKKEFSVHRVYRGPWDSEHRITPCIWLFLMHA